MTWPARVLLVLVHLGGSHLALLDRPRSRWLSFAGGASVAFVFLHLLGIVAGWAAGAFHDVPGPVAPALTAALAGGIILNVLKEELPRERESRFGAFAAGLAALAGLAAPFVL